MKIYLVGPITGKIADEVFQYFTDLSIRLLKAGYEVIHPLLGKGYLRTEVGGLKPDGYQMPASTNHAIFERDKWMVSQADIILANLTGADRVSIGSVMELAWASMLGKHTVVVMGEQNVHRHSFVLEAADILFPTMDAAIDYLIDMRG